MNVPGVITALMEEDGYKSLYLSSPTFRQGVDAFVMQYFPLFLRGLAESAKERDEDFQASLRAVERFLGPKPEPIDAIGYAPPGSTWEPPK